MQYALVIIKGMAQKLLTVAEAAEDLGVSIDTIRRWDKRGLIKATRSDLNYRLFNMAEVRRLHVKTGNVDNGKSHYKILRARNRSNFTSLDLFAGAGGTALGLYNAGLNHLFLNEYDKHALMTLRNNMPEWDISSDDVHSVDFSHFRKKVDVIEGGFPCQSFSYAGKKLGFGDARGTLFYEFVRAVREVQPKVAVGENVRGLLRHDGGRTLATMVKLLQKEGYLVAHRVLRSQYLDVPQKRERLVIIAVRKGLGLPILFPKERDYTISIREALVDCPASFGQKYPDKKAKILEKVPPGGYWKDLPENMKKEYMGRSYYLGGGKTGMARRLSWDEPSLTLTCSPAQKQTERCHPDETRPLTVREYARIQTFPDSWEFSGSMSAAYKQIGNAVPVNLGFHIGRCIIAMLEKRMDQETMEIKD